MARRLHPAAFLIHTLSGLRGLLAPFAIAIVAGGSIGRAPLWALLALVASTVLGYARWNSTRYWTSDTALHYRSGVFTPDEKALPRARISAIDEVQGPIQRLFGVVALHVQLAAGDEVVLTALTHEDAAALRAELGHLAAGVGARSEQREPDWRLTPRMLLLAALTGPQVAVLAPVVGAVGALAQQGFASEDDARSLADRIPDSTAAIVLLVVALIAAALVVALLGAIVAFGGFAVTREDTRLRIRRGLLQRRAASIGIDRVHAVRIVEGAARRPLRLCSVRLELAGYADERSEAQTLVPLCRRRDVREVLAALLPELPLPAEPEPQRPPPRARRRYALRPALELGTAGALAALIAVEAGAPHALWLLAVAGALAGAALGAARHRDAGWWLTGDVLTIRRLRVLMRTTTVARVRRLQDRTMSESLPQRRGRLASVRVTVASGHHARIAHLERVAAADLFAELAPG